MVDRLIAGIEAGGTKFVCALGTGPGEIVARGEIETRQPEQTMADVLRFFARADERGYRPQALGIGAFGPLETSPAAANYGQILATPKPGWSGFNLREQIGNRLGVPSVIDTDVNAAAFAEYAWGAGRGCDSLLYVTVGTGVGVGALLNGKAYLGRHHPEMGHMRVPPGELEPEGFGGVCPYHGDCVEGLASGNAISRRWGQRLSELPFGHDAWALEAGYLAAFFANLTFAFQPEKIIVGGGAAHEHLLQLVRESLLPLLGGYRPSLSSRSAIDAYLVAPGLGHDAGILGALALGQRALV